MALPIGAKLGPYEIVSPIGAGGMSEVYLAHETRLNRKVALKVFPATLVHEDDRLRRFERDCLALKHGEWRKTTRKMLKPINST
jgi:serine/threonine protein kinase